MRQLISFILFSLIGSFFVQSQEIERLKEELKTSQNDTARVWQLRDLAYYYQSKNLDSAIYFGQEGYKLANTLNFHKGKIWSLYQVALAYEFKDELDSALTIHNQALKIATNSKDVISEAKLMNAIGSSYYFAGNYLDALTYYNKGLSLSESINYNEGLAHALNNIGVIYRTQRRHVLALEIYKKSLEIKYKERDTLGIITSLYNVGLTHSLLNQHSESLETFLKAKTISELYKGPKLGMANISFGIGTAYFNLRKYNDAKKYLKISTQSSDIETNEKYTAILYLGAINIKEGNLTEGIKQIDEAYNYAVSSGRKDLQKNILKERAVAYEKNSNYLVASESWKAFSILSDSINNESQQWAIEELQARYELKDKETTISLQNLQLEKEANQKQWYLIFGIFIVLALLVISLFLRKILKQRKQLIFQMSEKVEALHLNKLLLREMHHRTKNNLQLINSILNLQSRTSINPEVKKSLEISRDNVSAIGLLHNQLYNNQEFKDIDFKAYVEELCNYFNEAFSLKTQNITLSCQCDAFKIDVDKAVPLGLILNETITNAIKHAFVEKMNGEINLNIIQQKNKISMEVKDNGIGIQNDSFKNNGTGTKLINIFSEKFEAKIDYLNTNPGTLFRFSFEQ